MAHRSIANLTSKKADYMTVSLAERLGYCRSTQGRCCSTLSPKAATYVWYNSCRTCADMSGNPHSQVSSFQIVKLHKPCFQYPIWVGWKHTVGLGSHKDPA